MMKYKTVCLFLVLCLLSAKATSETDEDNEEVLPLADFEEEPEPELDEESIEYAKGSVCGYCTYCKFCKLCEDCPCERSKSKPNCHMCKYCKFCYLCDAFCGTICQAGGILDRVSAALVNSLPTFDKAEVEGDIESVHEWIEKKDEL